MSVQSVCLMSGPDRHLTLGALTVHLCHAPRWQLVAPHRTAGTAVRALAWSGLNTIKEGLDAIECTLPTENINELAAA